MGRRPIDGRSVGLPDAAVREARERVRAALINCGFDFPLRRITANLAPADLQTATQAIGLAVLGHPHERP